ncbi:MAG TPA: PQQ-dependent sugar dehydrogenase, partial [Xanthomonadales bacterium]|nr:PQQ-dependent sugar dehydrogenase [Xanthomonadales bacterium]
VLDISDRTLNDTGETGLLGLAFHPEFPENNKAYVFYTNKINGEYESYLSEFISTDDGVTLDAASERNILTLTGHSTHNHKAGTVAFGPDGYLYLSLGDGGTPLESQNTFSLFGTLIRIDVDDGNPYAIPPDNPFSDGINGAPEIYAYGFRNPWRWTFDSLGRIWLTDVGLSSWEEINLVQPGANYGWPILEGLDCRLQADCSDEGLTPPLYAYPHDNTGGFVVVGGFVYRGQEFPELQGRFIYADGTDRVWALLLDDQGQPDPELLIDGGLQGSIIHSMFEDESGELYLVKGGPIYRLTAADDPLQSDFPATLSETGCVDPLDPTRVTQGAIPYRVNTAFWTDGAAKSRWLALPDGESIEVGEDGDFHFPIGTVLIKEFRVDDRRIETRLFTRHDDGNWAGYTYAWNDEETEAELVGPDGMELDLDGQPYLLPSRSQCLFCHSEAAGRSLGLEIQQQNGEFHYPSTGRSANQLTTLELIGALDMTLGADPEDLPAFPSIDDHSVSFSERARAYLHTNCSSCHRPGGPGRGPADMRFQPLEYMNICDVMPAVSDLGIEDARLLAPGHPERSIIAVRAGALGGIAMPPVGKNRVDVNAVAVIEEFIAELESCYSGDGP